MFVTILISSVTLEASHITTTCFVTHQQHELFKDKKIIHNFGMRDDYCLFIDVAVHHI